MPTEWHAILIVAIKMNKEAKIKSILFSMTFYTRNERILISQLYRCLSVASQTALVFRKSFMEKNYEIKRKLIIIREIVRFYLIFGNINNKTLRTRKKCYW